MNNHANPTNSTQRSAIFDGLYDGDLPSRDRPRAREPGDDHPITITADGARVVVSFAGEIIADSVRALTLRETNYRPVHYIPREDVRMDLLVLSGPPTYCPYKGDFDYYSINVGEDWSINSVWTYEMPFPAVASIAKLMAFSPGRMGRTLASL